MLSSYTLRKWAKGVLSLHDTRKVASVLPKFRSKGKDLLSKSKASMDLCPFLFSHQQKFLTARQGYCRDQRVIRCKGILDMLNKSKVVLPCLLREQGKLCEEFHYWKFQAYTKVQWTPMSLSFRINHYQFIANIVSAFPTLQPPSHNWIILR